MAEEDLIKKFDGYRVDDSDDDDPVLIRPDGGMSFAQRLMPDQKPEHAVDEAAELLVGAVNQ